MKYVMDCAFCGGTASLTTEERTLNYKGEEYAVTAVLYLCDHCGEAFNTTETDTATLQQVYDQYESRHPKEQT